MYTFLNLSLKANDDEISTENLETDAIIKIVLDDLNDPEKVFDQTAHRYVIKKDLLFISDLKEQIKDIFLDLKTTEQDRNFKFNFREYSFELLSYLCAKEFLIRATKNYETVYSINYKLLNEIHEENVQIEKTKKIKSERLDRITSENQVLCYSKEKIVRDKGNNTSIQWPIHSVPQLIKSISSIGSSKKDILIVHDQEFQREIIENASGLLKELILAIHNNPNLLLLNLSINFSHYLSKYDLLFRELIDPYIKPYSATDWNDIQALRDPGEKFKAALAIARIYLRKRFEDNVQLVNRLLPKDKTLPGGEKKISIKFGS